MTEPRRPNPPRGPSLAKLLDEQLWPINVALVMLGAFLAGAVLANLRFDDGRWYANALVHLVGVAVLVGGWMAAATLVRSQMLKRSLQLSAVLSFALHIVMVIVLLYIPKHEDEQPPTLDTRPKGERITLDVRPSAPTKLQQQRRELALPLAVPVTQAAPALALAPPKHEEPPIPREAPQAAPTDPGPAPVTTSPPPGQKRNAPLMDVAPRRAETPSLLSRQDLRRAPLETVVPIGKPTPAVAQPKPIETITAPPKAEVAQAPTPVRPANREPTAPEQRPETKIARTEDKRDVRPQTTSSPTLPRKMNEPSVAPRTPAAVADAPAVPRSNQPDAIKPSILSTAKSTSSGPTPAARPVDNPFDVAAANTPLGPKRGQPAENHPNQARTPSPSPGRTKAVDSAPSPTAVASDVPSRAPSPATTASASNSGSPGATGKMFGGGSGSGSGSGASRKTGDADVAALFGASGGTGSGKSPTAGKSGSGSGAASGAGSGKANLARAGGGGGGAPTGTQVAAEGSGSSGGSGRGAGGGPAPASTTIARQSTGSGVGPGGPGSGGRAAAPEGVAGAPGSGGSGGGPGGSGPSRLPSAGPGSAVASGANGGLPGGKSRSAATAPGGSGADLSVAASVGTGNTGPPSPRPVAGSVSRSETSSPPTSSPGGNSSRQPLDVATSGAASSAARAIGGLAGNPSAVPTSRPNAASGNSPARSGPTGGGLSSPRPIDVVGVPGGGNGPGGAGGGAGEGGGGPIPTQVAVGRSGSGGGAGTFAGANGGRGEPGSGAGAAAGTGLVPAGGVARAAGGSQSPGGAGGAGTGGGAGPARGQLGGQVASTNTRADVAAAAVAGGAVTGGPGMATGAAVARGDASGVLGAISAGGGAGGGKGDVEAGGGAGAIAASGGGPASGGASGPAVALGGGGGIGRSASAGAGGEPSFNTTVQGVAAAPAGTTGGQPLALEATAGASGLTKSDGGGVGALAGGPTVEAPLGPAGGSAAGDQQGGAVAARAAMQEMAPGAAQAGGGNGSGSGGIGRTASSGGSGPLLAGSKIEIPGGGGSGQGGEAGGGSGGGTGLAMAAGGVEREGGSDGPRPGNNSDGKELGGAAGGGLAAEGVGAAQIGRAAAIDAVHGPAQAGGGTGSPGRTTTAGPVIAGGAKADVASVAGAEFSGGSPQGAPLSAAGVEVTRTPGGAVGPAFAGTAGAAQGEVAMDAPLTGAPGALAGRRNASPGNGSGPVPLDAQGNSGPTKSNRPAGLPAGMSDQVAASLPAGAASGAGGDSKGAMATMADGVAGAGPMAREDSKGGAIAVSVDAPEGPGGVGNEIARDAGFNDRRAQRSSEDVHLREGRFARAEVSGVPDLNTSATLAADAFRERGRRRGKGLGEGGGSSTKTEASVEKGLVFLARHQSPDGSFSLHKWHEGHPEVTGDEVPKSLHSDTAATGLVLLTFLGAGYHHKEDLFRANVQAGLDWMVKNQKANGDLFVAMDDESNKYVALYSHAIAALALCEAYGMTHDPKLKEPAQKALDFIVAAQHPKLGAWRYKPQDGTDTSVSGWMLMALKSGELAGFKVPKETYERATQWLDYSQESRTNQHLYRYNPDATLDPAVGQEEGRQVTKTMTSVGLLMRQYTGWRRSNEFMVKGADYLADHPPSDRDLDTYYWYYATQVMFHMGGTHWEKWQGQLYPLLRDSQLKDGPLAGSWNPQPDRWGSRAGRMYVTTMNLLSLEVMYRYLPIFDDTGKE